MAAVGQEMGVGRFGRGGGGVVGAGDRGQRVEMRDRGGRSAGNGGLSGGCVFGDRGVGAAVFRERGHFGVAGGGGADGGPDVPPLAVGPVRGGPVACSAPVRPVAGEGGDGGAAV